MVTRIEPNQIFLERVYDAPLKAVWEAWTDPDKVAKWWGPRGFTLTTHAKDFRPGGYWHYTMHGPDGVDYENKTIYHEIEVEKKLLYDHGGNDDRPPLFRVLALFSESGGKTTLQLTMTLPTAEEAESARKFIKAAGGNATWDRLAEYLDQTERGRSSFVITRSFAASPESLFDAWTDPERLCKWLPPHGFDMEVLRGDMRSGRSCFFRMFDQGAVSFYGKFEYVEIHKPNLLVYVHRFCDEQERIGRHPALPVFPEAMLQTVTFTDEGNGMTRVTVTSHPASQSSREEIEAFVTLRSSMTSGWTGSFDKLEGLLFLEANR
jgi:uncharacterized protein YndB with AHSA1/START domain